MKLLIRAIVLAGLGAALAAPLALGQDNPYVNYTCAPNPVDCSGWRTADVTLRWFPTSEVEDSENCPGVEAIRSEGTTNWTCQVLVGGEWFEERAVVRIDKSPPAVPSAVASRPPDANGWYRDAVRVDFVGDDAKPGIDVSGIDSCTSAVYVGPDTGGGTLTGTCRDRAGNVSSPGAFSLRFDATPPEVTAMAPTRPPDHGRWYTRPVAFAVSGADATSGIAACDPLVHDGPDAEASVVRGVCRDLAGNVGTRAVTVAYDATPPALDTVKVRLGDRVVRLNWAAADASKVRVVRSPGRGGDERTELHDGGGTSLTDRRVRNGRRYEYRLSAVDRAGNESSRTVKVVPRPRLISPANRARVDRPPVLRWTPVRGADYYNVQLWRGKRKVLSTWPSRARLELKRAWRYFGKRRLQPGVEYRWLVWPGAGPRALNDYGRLIGRRKFVFAPNT